MGCIFYGADNDSLAFRLASITACCCRSVIIVSVTTSHTLHLMTTTSSPHQQHQQWQWRRWNTANMVAHGWENPIDEICRWCGLLEWLNKILESSQRYVTSVQSTIDRFHHLPIRLRSFIETNFFRFQNDVSTEMEEPRNIKVYNYERRYVTTTYGFCQELRTTHIQDR